jgi:hypothetical protein
MQVSGKEISAIVNAVISTKGKSRINNALANGGRMMKFLDVFPDTEQINKINKAVLKSFPNAKVLVAIDRHPTQNFGTDGLKIRVVISKV